MAESDIDDEFMIVIKLQQKIHI